MFDAVGQIDITGVDEVTETLVEGLIALGEQQNVSLILICLNAFRNIYFHVLKNTGQICIMPKINAYYKSLYFTFFTYYMYLDLFLMYCGFI